LENSTSPEDIMGVVSKLIEWLTAPEHTRLRRSFSIWINRFLRPSIQLDETMPEIKVKPEVKLKFS
jgi:hypothetical protein